MSGMEVTGFVIGIIGLIDPLFNRCIELKDRLDTLKELPEQWSAINASMRRLREDLPLINEQLREHKHLIDDSTAAIFGNSILEMEKSFSQAEQVANVLEKDALLRTSQALGNSKVRAMLRVVAKLMRRTTKAAEQLKLLESRLSDTRLSLLTITTAIASLKSHNPNFREEYCKHFAVPGLPSNIVLNFNCDVSTSMTTEARLKQSLLSSSNHPRVTAAVGRVLQGVVGMSGVGKSVALQALCLEKEVQEKYCDGVFYMSLGQGITENDFVEEIALWVESSGGVSRARNVRNAGSASAAVARASLWFKDKRALFVCDDIWSHKGCSTGFLHALRWLLSCSSFTGMVISTRDWCIADSCDGQVEFSPRETRGDEAKRILMKHANISFDFVRSMTIASQQSFLGILDACEGLPVALAVAGSSLRRYVKDCEGNIGRAVNCYACELKSEVENLGEEDVGSYRALRVVVERSIGHCELWARTDEGRRKVGGNVSLKQKFEALCVLRKQTWVPWTCLARLWEIDELRTKQVLKKLSEQNLVVRRRRRMDNREIDGMIMRDLVLEQSRQFAKEKSSTAEWHARLLHGYVQDLQESPYFSSESSCRTWWNDSIVPDDGYIHSNLAYHLVEGRKIHELLSLVLDIRWSLRRMKVGGVVAIRDDFREMIRCASTRADEIEEVQKSLEEGWLSVNRSTHTMAFEMYSRLRSKAQYSDVAKRFLMSVSKYSPKPCLIPRTDVMNKLDNRQRSRHDFENAVRAIHLDPAKNLLFAAEGRNIHIIDLQANLLTQTLEGHKDVVTCLAVSDDCQVIISGSDDETVRLWKRCTGQYLYKCFHVHNRLVTCMDVSADGLLIVSGSKDRTVLVWDTNTGENVLEPLRGHTYRVACIAVSRDKSLITSGSLDGAVRIWDSSTGNQVFKLRFGNWGPVSCLALSSDNNLVLAGFANGHLCIWDVQTRQYMLNPFCGHNDRVSCIALTEDGKKMVSASDDGQVQMWNIHDGTAVIEPLLGHKRGVSSVTMHDNGNVVISGSLDGTVRIWDVHDIQRSLERIRGHRAWVSCVSVSADGSLIVSGSYDGTLRVWDKESGQSLLRPLRGHKGWVICLAISEDGRLIASGSTDGSVRLWNSQNGECMIEALCENGVGVSCVAVSTDKSVIVSGSLDGKVYLLDARTGQHILEPLCGPERRVNFVALSRDNRKVFSASNDGTVTAWDILSGNCLFQPLGRHDDWVTCLAVSCDSRLLVSGSIDGTLSVWNTLTGKKLHETINCGGAVNHLQFENDSSVVFVTTTDGALRLDAATGARLEAYGSVFHNKRSIYVTQTNETCKLVAIMPDDICSFHFNKEHAVVVVGLSGGEVIIADIVIR